MKYNIVSAFKDYLESKKQISKKAYIPVEEVESILRARILELKKEKNELQTPNYSVDFIDFERKNLIVRINEVECVILDRILHSDKIVKL